VIRRRILRWLARHEILDEHSAEEMLAWEHQGGFSLDASTRIEGWDRQGLERLARYCARQPFSLERLERYDAERLVYRFPRTSPEGRNYLILTPFQLLFRLAKLIPPPYKHRVRYFGVFAPNAKLREAVVSSAGPAAALQARLSDAARKMGIDGGSIGEAGASSSSSGGRPSREKKPNQPVGDGQSPARPSLAVYCWAILLARIYDVLPLLCTQWRSDYVCVS